MSRFIDFGNATFVAKCFEGSRDAYQKLSNLDMELYIQTSRSNHLKPKIHEIFPRSVIDSFNEAKFAHQCESFC